MNTKSFWGKGKNLRGARIKAVKYAVAHIESIKKSHPQSVVSNVKYKLGDFLVPEEAKKKYKENKYFMCCIVSWKQRR